MRTLGILGGMGPAATVDFLSKIVRLAGEQWPRTILEMDPSIPSRTLAAMGKGPDPGLAIYRAVCELEMKGADVIAVPCNSAHAWYPGPETKWLNMIEVVAAAMKKRGIEKPLIVGGYATVEKRLYDPYFKGGAVYPPAKVNDYFYELIAKIKRVNAGADDGFENVIGTLIGYCTEDHDAALLACTELSMVWPENVSGEIADTPVFDSSWEYAKAVMRKLKEGYIGN